MKMTCLIFICLYLCLGKCDYSFAYKNDISQHSNPIKIIKVDKPKFINSGSELQIW